MELVNSEVVRREMLRRALGVGELANLAGVQPAVISRMAKGDYRARLGTVGRIAKALKLDNPYELLKRSEPLD
ncbi:MAG: helix-turn-helix transcriptional regulator [Selenomonadaceae bacterium]|nr:helix-turn-helix transcriptional regulator [Selenomonadaceae bacterium]